MCKYRLIQYIFLIILILFATNNINANSVYKIVNGNLFESWHFNFKLFAKEFIGVILYSIDSRGNQFRVIVKEESGTMEINFNKIIKVVSLNTLCGCQPCLMKTMELYFQLQSSQISGRCNNHRTETLLIDDKYSRTNEKSIILYPTPRELIGKEGYMSIRVGNIGPYVGQNNETVSIFKYQLIGCLLHFIYNYKSIKLHGEEDKIQSECYKCKSNICNTGICRKDVVGHTSCDCSLAYGNGPTCEIREKTYVQGPNNSYNSTTKIKSNIHVKLSWRQFHNRTFCLLNIVSGLRNFTIVVDGDNIMIGDTVVSKNDLYRSNFIYIIIENSKIQFQTAFNKSTKLFKRSGLIQINVGFSKNEDRCMTFEGVYDLYYNESLLRQERWDALPITPTIQLSNKSTTGAENQPNIKMTIVYAGLAILIVVFVLCALNLMVFLRKRQTKTSSNIYDAETIECEVSPQQPYYSSLDYHVVDSISDGFIAPGQQETNLEPPDLPAFHP